jgi:hypothetical protein
MRPPITVEMQGVLALLDNPKGVSGIKETARNRLRYLGDGAYATVYEYPDDPSKVIRVNEVDYSRDHPHDGWFPYAERCRRRDQVSPFAPKLYDMIHVGQPGRGVWIAISERLEEIDMASDEMLDLIEPIRKLIFFRPRNCPEYEKILEERQPGLLKFIRGTYFGRNDLDINSENILKRGDTIVINDPDGEVEDRDIGPLEDMYTIKGRPLAKIECSPVASGFSM